MAFRKLRRERTAYRARTTALIVATLLFANIVAVVGLGVTARAGEIHAMVPYAPLSWEKRHSGNSDVAAPRARPVAAIVRVDRNTLAAAARHGDRVVAATPAGSPPNRTLVILVVLGAFSAMTGVSILMFRGLARDLDDMERRRRDFLP